MPRRQPARGRLVSPRPSCESEKAENVRRNEIHAGGNQERYQAEARSCDSQRGLREIQRDTYFGRSVSRRTGTDLYRSFEARFWRAVAERWKNG